MKKLFSSLLLVVMLAALCAGRGLASEVKTPARIGVLAPIGADAEGVRKWSENVAKAEGKSEPFKNPNTIVLYDQLTPMLMDLMAGHIDRIAVSRVVGAYIVAWNDTLQLNDNNHNPILGYSIAMRREDGTAVGAIDQAIEGMKADGTLDELVKKWITEAGVGASIAINLPRFEDADTIRVAVTGDLPPLDIIRADGRPSGFNTAFLAELSKRLHKNFHLVSVMAGARQAALESRKVDAVFWTIGVFDRDAKPLPYPLDVMEGVTVSKPYFLDSRVSVSLK